VSKIRVLIAEDFLPFQKMIGWILQDMPQVEVVGVAADGLEAIQKAQELQPDLIIMDIGLPKLNGMESARRILAVKPQSKVLFLTQETSGRVVHNAFQLGARGYVIKDRLVHELPVAVSAVLEGKRVVSAGLLLDSSNSFTTRGLEPVWSLNKITSSRTKSRQSEQTLSDEHQVYSLQVYSDEATLLDSAVNFIKTALRDGESVLVVGNEPIQDRLSSKLQLAGVDLATIAQCRNYISLNSEELMSQFIPHDMPRSARYATLFQLPPGQQMQTLVIALPKHC
jgi:DNA-binding NarL/FixJ family response regulator